MTTAQAWGDAGVFRPRELGPPGRAAGSPWRLDPVVDVPDTVIAAGRVGPLEVRAASIRGTTHRGHGDVRQDAVGVADVGGRYLLVAVADGVTGASHSHRGAALAVRHSLNHLAWTLPSTDLDVVDMIGALRAADRVIREAGPAPESRATTLTVAVVELGWAGRGHRYRAVRVGDSPAFVLSDGVFGSLFRKRDATGDTLPTPRGPADGVRGVLRAGEALVIASAGVGAPLRSGVVSGYLAGAWAAPPGPVAFTHQLQFDLRSADDDRTAAVIWAGHER